MNSQPLYLIHVVQRGFHDGYTANLYWFKNRERSQYSGPPHTHQDVPDQGRFLMRGIFISDGPAWRLSSEAHFVLQRDFVRLDYNPINLKGKRLALRFPLTDIFVHRFDRFAHFPILANLEAHLGKRFKNFGVAFLWSASIDQQIVSKKIEQS